MYNDPHVPEGQCMLWGEKTLNEERKKTESHSAIEHSIKTEENQWDYLVCADGA